MKPDHRQTPLSRCRRDSLDRIARIARSMSQTFLTDTRQNGPLRVSDIPESRDTPCMLPFHNTYSSVIAGCDLYNDLG